jgi:hypothetical protein
MRKGDTMKQGNYLTRASRRFLSGTPYRSPVDAVTHGVRSLEEWAKVLNEERERWQQQNANCQTSISKSRRHTSQAVSKTLKGGV